MYHTNVVSIKERSADEEHPAKTQTAQNALYRSQYGSKHEATLPQLAARLPRRRQFRTTVVEALLPYERRILECRPCGDEEDEDVVLFHTHSEKK